MMLSECRVDAIGIAIAIAIEQSFDEDSSIPIAIPIAIAMGRSETGRSYKKPAPYGAGGFLVLKSIYSFDAICSSA
jgi:hypothetical protein